MLAGLVFAADLIPFDRIENLAQKLVTHRYGPCYFDEVITYYSIDDLPGAYALIYRSLENEPRTIVMGARYTTSPVNEISKALPRSQTVYEEVLEKARALGIAEPKFQRLYYFGPGEEYCGFEIDGKEFLINACTFRTLEKSILTENWPAPHPELEALTKQKWDTYFNTTDFSARDSAYIPGVPWIDWVYGCSPTAASMIFWYWDSRGYGRFVDHFFTRWDPPYGAWKDCANVNRELALAMYTDSMSGGTYISNIRPGMINVANSVNGYSCTGSTSPQGHSGNQYVFDWIKAQIDAGNPCHWNVLNYYYSGDYINHSITGIGYLTQPGDTFVQIHTTWGWSGEPFWALWTYQSGVYSRDYCVTFLHGGSNSNDIALVRPQGGFLFKNIKYRIRWTTTGSSIDHVKIWYSTGNKAQSYDSLYWTLITANTPNDGEYLWVAPNQDSALRINLTGLSSSNQRLAADGPLRKSQSTFPSSTSNLLLVGHFIEAGATEGVVYENDHVYTVSGPDGFVIADVSDSSLADEVGRLALPGYSCALDKNGNYVYIADQEDTLRVISVSNPSNPSQVGKLALNVDRPVAVFALGNYVYVACRGSGLYIVNVTNPSSPSLAGSYDTQGQAYYVYVEDTIAYVADGTRGLRVINVADPTNPSEIGFYDTNGITQGIDLDGNIMYLAEGGSGIKVFNVSDPTNPQQLSSLDTPGTAKNVLICDSLFVADAGSGIKVFDVSNPANPIEVGSMQTFGSATYLAHSEGNMLYLADLGDGIYLIHEDLSTSSQEMKAENMVSLFNISSPQTHVVKFSVYLSTPGDVAVNIYDASGRLFRSISRANLCSGEHEFKLLPQFSGVYFIQVKTDEGSVARKVVFVK